MAIVVNVIAPNTSVTGNVSDFNAGGFTAPAAGVLVVCAMLKGSVARHVTDITIDGVSVGANFNAPTTDRTSKCAIGWATVASGSRTVHILLNDLNGLSTSGTVQCYLLENTSTTVAAGSQVNINSGSNAAGNNLATTQIANGASIYAVCVGGSVSSTWSSATEDIDGTVGRMSAHTGPPDSAGAHTETATISSTGSQLQAVGISFGPSAVPTNYPAVLDAATYTYTGQTINGLTGKLASLAVGTFTYTGRTINAMIAMRAQPGVASFTFTGIAMSLTRPFRAVLSAGVYVVTGGWHAFMPRDNVTNRRVNRKWWARLLNGGR